MFKYLLILIVSIFIIGCGYRPTSHYVKKELGLNSKYYVNMSIAVNSAKNAIIIKDAIRDVIISKFGGSLVNRKKDADTVINAAISSISTSAIQYDTTQFLDNGEANPSYGYAKLYRTSVQIVVSYSNEKSKGSFTVGDSYEFAVDGAAVVSETKRFQAIKNAASKAFDRVISSIAVRSIEYKKPEDINTTKDINATKP